MRPWAQSSLSVIGVVFLLAQFFPPTRDNPPTDPARTIHASLNLDPIVTSALTRACNDCHSNLTVSPWYSRVAPVSWLVVSDVKRGRRALNLSDWKSLAPQRQQELVPEICKEVSQREMPTEEYVLMHPQSKLSHVEVLSICKWAHSISQFGPEPAEDE